MYKDYNGSSFKEKQETSRASMYHIVYVRLWREGESEGWSREHHDESGHP